LFQGSTLLVMEAPPKTLVTINVSFNIDLEYDSFTGRTLSEFLTLIEDDLFDAVNELRPEIQDIYHMQTRLVND
jgi:hypothetical protein